MKQIYLLFLCALFFVRGQTQSPITLSNASFEDTPGHSRAPRDWASCSFPEESPPDVQPDMTFRVTLPAYDGSTYLGMVVRDNNTWEGVSQALSAPLEAGLCYRLDLAAACSATYLSQSRVTGISINYDQPTLLRVWGGEQFCDPLELLGVIGPVSKPDWEEYSLLLQPQKRCSYLFFEAVFVGAEAYCGNLLLDGLSDIVPIDCEQKEGVTRLPPLYEPLVTAGRRLVLIARPTKLAAAPERTALPKQGGYRRREAPAEVWGPRSIEVFPRVTNVDSLIAVIRLEGAKIRFSGDHQVMESLYEVWKDYGEASSSSQDFVGNKYLHRIVDAAIQLRATHKLSIAVEAASEQVAYARWLNIKHWVEEYGTKRVVRVITADQADPDEPWIVLPNGLLFYVEPR